MRRKGKGKATSQALTKRQVKAVTAIAKKVDLKSDETKFFRLRYSEAIGAPVGNKVITSYNLFYHGVSQGTSQHDMLGNKINWRGVAIHYYYTPNTLYGTNQNWLGHNLHIGIIQCKTFKTTTSLNFSDIQDNSMQVDAWTGFLEAGKAKWLVKKTIPIRQLAAEATNPPQNNCQPVQGKLWIKRNQMIEFNNFLTSFELNNKYNYYFVYYGVGEGTPSTSSVGEIRFQGKVYFKDA